MTVREIAQNILVRAEKGGQYSGIALDAAIRREKLPPEDRGLLTVLVMGVAEKKLTLDHALSSLCDRPVETLSPDVRAALRMGIYQLAFLDKVPDHAAVNETVALGSRKTKGFINAVLRNFIRRDKKIDYPDEKTDPIGYLSARYSVCPGICRLFSGLFGFERAESLFSADTKTPPLTLRVNPFFAARDEYLRDLRTAGYDAEPTAGSPWGIRLRKGASPTDLPGFSGGAFFVQDEASQICVEALDVRPGMRVWDVCACPGSKSFGIALNMENRGAVLSTDLHESKLSLIRSGAERLGIGIITAAAHDGRDPLPDLLTDEGQVDRVLCDVPCSGYGVMAKKPELRCKDPSVSAGLPEIQKDILTNASRHLRPGGKLVYSTCTVLPRENEEVVNAFLLKNPGFTLLWARTLYPDTDGTDGFFCAVLEKGQ